MKQTNYFIMSLCIILGLILISGCSQQTKVTNNNESSFIKTNICEDLARNLDEQITDTNNPPGRFIIGGYEGIVGGILVKVSEPQYYVPSDEEQKILTYTLTFKGANKTGDLYLRASSNSSSPYIHGLFYRFDLKNKNQYSMQLSGVFMDSDLTALEHLEECD